MSDERKAVQDIIGEMTLKGMNGMVYDAVVLGPWDLSLGPGRLKDLLKDTIFPAVTSNLVMGDKGQFFGVGNVIVERGGVRVGILGIMPEEEVKVAARVFQRRGQIHVMPVKEALEKAVDEIRGKVDILVLVSHASYKETCNIVKMFPKIDLAICASDEGETPGDPIPSKPVVMAAYRGTSLGYVKFEMREGKAFLRQRKRIDLNCSAPDIPEDPIVAALIGPDFDEKLNQLAKQRSEAMEVQLMKEAKELWKLSPKEYLEQEMKKQDEEGVTSPENPFLQKKQLPPGSGGAKSGS